MTNTLTRHFAEDHSRALHLSTSNRFHTTVDVSMVTCSDCVDAIEDAQKPFPSLSPATASSGERISYQRAKRSRLRALELLGSSDDVHVHLPDAFVADARECDPDLEGVWSRVTSSPRLHHAGAWGYWVSMTRADAAAMAAEAAYRAEYWLTDAYGVEGVSAKERDAGKAAATVADTLAQIVNLRTGATS